MLKSHRETSASIALLEPAEFASSKNKILSKKHLHSRWQQSSARRTLDSVTRRTSTWRFIVLFGLVITLAVLILNLSLLIWSRARPHGGNMLYKGDCRNAKTTITYSSLAINILSTLLLGASNAAMQCLCAPTRAEVDKVHATGSWLDIGISGLRNWRRIGRWRKYAWGFILLSSLPLHLLYNSVIFSTSQANDYMALLVAPDFLDGTILSADPNGALANIGQNVTGSSIRDSLPMANVSDIASALQTNISSLTRLENAECIRTYGTDFVTNFLNVLLVTNGSNTYKSGSILAGYEYHPAPTSSNSGGDEILNLDWICDGLSCNIPNKIRQASSWDYTLMKDERTRVSYCLAQPVHPQCTVEILPQVLIIVIVCNILKAICFTLLLTKRNFTPLIILGDAIASFITDPDPTALSSGPLSAESIRKAYIAEPLRFSTQRQSLRWRQNRPPRRVTQWHATRRRWASAVGPKRWTFTILGLTALWFTGFGFLYNEQRNGVTIPFSTFWTQGFGSPYPLATLQLPKGFPVIGVVLLANLPQAILSFIYLYYNDVVTCMLLSAEFVRHSHAHKGLRVTLPQGEQRGTYTLSLPLKVSVPLLAASGVLHWTMSQSLFLAKVNVLNPYGEINIDRSFSTLGWSALALLILLIVSGLMLVALVASGFRKFGAGAPTVGSNSRAMMFASFTLGEGREEAVKKLKYGVLGNLGNNCKRVGFGSGDVGELSEDELYA